MIPRESLAECVLYAIDQSAGDFSRYQKIPQRHGVRSSFYAYLEFSSHVDFEPICRDGRFTPFEDEFLLRCVIYAARNFSILEGFQEFCDEVRINGADLPTPDLSELANGYADTLAEWHSASTLKKTEEPGEFQKYEKLLWDRRDAIWEMNRELTEEMLNNRKKFALTVMRVTISPSGQYPAFLANQKGDFPPLGDEFLDHGWASEDYSLEGRIDKSGDPCLLTLKEKGVDLSSTLLEHVYSELYGPEWQRVVSKQQQPRGRTLPSQDVPKQGASHPRKKEVPPQDVPKQAPPHQWKRGVLRREVLRSRNAVDSYGEPGLESWREEIRRAAEAERDENPLGEHIFTLLRAIDKKYAAICAENSRTLKECRTVTALMIINHALRSSPMVFFHGTDAYSSVANLLSRRAQLPEGKTVPGWVGSTGFTLSVTRNGSILRGSGKIFITEYHNDHKDDILRALRPITKKAITFGMAR
ncbi:hypothetical protein AB0D66_33805 [Streptomyces sp. NPDC048270]|uniref:hypothetical protein n=1 Tax=Streptomyces sp. NPDC048270 TaxID=3154615 RepID=UPI0033F3578E